MNTNSKKLQIINIDGARRQHIKLDRPGRYQVNLNSQGAEVEVVGQFEAKNQDQVSVEIIIHHQAPQTSAKTTLKGVADDFGFIKFVGRIIIDQNCPHVNSFLTERVLLLSDQARAETVPDLEIHSDDVKCSHAASIAEIDENQVFYLMSRGLNKAMARGMIAKGFLEVLN